MFSVNMADRTHSAGEVTWHRNLMSIRGLSRLLMFFISFHVTASLGPQMPRYQYRKWAIAVYCRRLLPKKVCKETGFTGKNHCRNSHLRGFNCCLKSRSIGLITADIILFLSQLSTSPKEPLPTIIRFIISSLRRPTAVQNTILIGEIPA